MSLRISAELTTTMAHWTEGILGSFIQSQLLVTGNHGKTEHVYVSVYLNIFPYNYIEIFFHAVQYIVYVHSWFSIGKRYTNVDSIGSEYRFCMGNIFITIHFVFYTLSVVQWIFFPSSIKFLLNVAPASRRL